MQKIIEFEEELYKKLKHTCHKQWTKLVKTYPQLSSISEQLTPGLGDGYKYLQHVLNNLYVSVYKYIGWSTQNINCLL